MNFNEFVFFNRLKHLEFVEEIWLYGSRARGDFSTRSDIDLAILCPQASESDWFEVETIIEKADTLLKIDAVRLDKLSKSDSLRGNILKFKKVLYKKGTDYMEKEFWKDYFESLGEAVARLGEVLQQPDLKKNDFLQDATIQRFEFCIELYWKVLKKFLAYEEVETTTPKDVVSKAYQFGLVDNEKIWLQMLHDRNKTSHVYKQEEAKRVFNNIVTYWPSIEANYENLKIKFYNK